MYATVLIGFFYLLTFILGFGAMVLVGQDAIKQVDVGGNMAAPLLAEALGGMPFLVLSLPFRSPPSWRWSQV